MRRLSLEENEPLPRGRHKLPAFEVRASQRARLLAAMLECVAEQGYAATTIGEVATRAHVSPNAFYVLFEDKLDCFLALSDEVGEELLGQMIAFDAAGDWATALREGAIRYLSWWQERQAWARTYLIELPSAGPRALAHRDRQYARFREMFEALAAWARREQPELPPFWPLAPQFIVHGITELVADHVRAERLDDLPELVEDIVRFVALLLADEATAGRVARPV